MTARPEGGARRLRPPRTGGSDPGRGAGPQPRRPALVIVAMRPADLPEILAIEADLFGRERWSEALFRSELDAGHYYLVARDDTGAVAGYAGLAVAPPDEAWVNNIAVRRERQRQGVGRALLEALLAEATRRGVRRVLLEVAADNEAAQRMYAEFGFEAVSVRRGYYQPSNTDALVMLREQ